MGLFSCSIPPSFVLSHNMTMINNTSNWLCSGVFHSPPVPSLFSIRWPLVTILSPHAPRPTTVGIRVDAARRTGYSTPYPAGGQHATTCYVFRFRQKFGEPCVRRKLRVYNDLRLFLP